MLAVLVLGGCASAPPSERPAYVGSNACADCHLGPYEAWASSSHAGAARVPGQELRPAFDGVRRELASAIVRPARSGDGQFLVEVDDGPARPVALVLGMQALEQVLVPAGGGRLQVVPIGFDPVRREWFDVFPEAPAHDDWAHWTNPGATANSECLECHMVGFTKGYASDLDQYASRWVEAGVGCEACHGPGSVHVAARQSWSRREPARYGGLDRDRMPGCVLCHARRAVIAEGYVPGAAPADFFDPELLDTPVYHADGQLQGEGYEWTSFQMSRMAAHGVTCADCHESHAGTLRAAGNALCLRCHARDFDEPAHTHHAVGSAGAQCVACHMPALVFMERDARRDHRIAPPDPAGAAAVGAPDACTRCHTDATPAWAARHVETWFPAPDDREARRRVASAVDEGRRRRADVAPDLLAVVDDERIDAVRRASAARLVGPWAHDPAVGARLIAALADPEPLVRAGAARSLGDANPVTSPAREALVHAARDPTRLVRVAAGFALRAVDPAATADGAGVQAAFGDWLAAQGVLAERPETHFNRGLFAEARGDRTTAEAAYRAALRLWPDDLPPRHNLAVLLAAQGRESEAAAELEAILARRPGWPPAAFALGLLEAGRGNWTAAAALLDDCLAGDPHYPRAAYNLAQVASQLGDSARARAALERAADDPASEVDALRDLVRMAHRSGDEAALARWLPRSLAVDPSVRDEPVLRALVDGDVASSE
jgi:predicted CXXCH cytochrome family protein